MTIFETATGQGTSLAMTMVSYSKSFWAAAISWEELVSGKSLVNDGQKSWQFRSSTSNRDFFINLNGLIRISQERDWSFHSLSKLNMTLLGPKFGTQETQVLIMFYFSLVAVTTISEGSSSGQPEPQLLKEFFGAPLGPHPSSAPRAGTAWCDECRGLPLPSPSLTCQWAAWSASWVLSAAGYTTSGYSGYMFSSIIGWRQFPDADLRWASNSGS